MLQARVVVAGAAAAVLLGGVGAVVSLVGHSERRTSSSLSTLSESEPTEAGPPTSSMAASPTPTVPAAPPTPLPTRAHPLPVVSAAAVPTLPPVLPLPTPHEMTPAEYDESLGFRGVPDSCRQARLGESCSHPGTRGSGGTGAPKGRELDGDDLRIWWESPDFDGNYWVAPIRGFYVFVVDRDFTTPQVAKWFPRTARSFTVHDLPPGSWNWCLQELNATGLGVAECEGHPVTVQGPPTPTPTTTPPPPAASPLP